MPLVCRFLLKRFTKPRFLGGTTEVEVVEEGGDGQWGRAWLWAAAGGSECNSPIQYCTEADGSTLLKPLGRTGYSALRNVMGCPAGSVVRLRNNNCYDWGEEVRTGNFTDFP